MSSKIATSLDSHLARLEECLDVDLVEVGVGRRGEQRAAVERHPHAVLQGGEAGGVEREFRGREKLGVERGALNMARRANLDVVADEAHVLDAAGGAAVVGHPVVLEGTSGERR